MSRMDVIGQNGNDGLIYDELARAAAEHEEDVVNAPTHYSLFPDMQVKDLIKKVLTQEEWEGYCKGNVLKYRLRAGLKGDAKQDIAKASVYRGWL